MPETAIEDQYNDWLLQNKYLDHGWVLDDAARSIGHISDEIRGPGRKAVVGKG